MFAEVVCACVNTSHVGKRTIKLTAFCAMDGLKRVCVKCIEKYDERQRKKNDEVRVVDW